MHIPYRWLKPFVINWLLFASLTLLGATAQSAALNLNDTGIKTCANATQNNQTCPVAGFPDQDGDYGTNSFSLTKLDANGKALPATATNHSCVKDNVTGLIYEIKTDDGWTRDKDWTYSWYDGTTGYANGGTCVNSSRCDTQKYIQDVNATKLCGYNDWRLPSIKEIRNLVDYGTSGLMHKDYFTDYSVSKNFWTSSDHYSYDYWYFDGYGDRGGSYDSSGLSVRLVRSGSQWPAPSFTDNGNGTIKDNNTGLIWAKCAEGQSGSNCATGSALLVTWEQAFNVLQHSTMTGCSKWRLPNIREWRSFINFDYPNPSINTTYFPNMPTNNYWWSSSHELDNYSILVINLSNGGIYYTSRSSAHYMRYVCANLVSYKLTLTKQGTGTGTVTSNPAGINCGSDCSETYTNGTVVTLTAASAAGSAFAGFSGNADCSDGTVTMNAAKTCTATFNSVTGAPIVSTNAPSVITATNAKLQGTVNPHGITTAVTFDFGLTTGYGTSIAATPGSIAANAAATAVTATKTGLTCNTRYNYRVKAVNNAGITYGLNKSFTTAACVSDFAVTSAVLTPSAPLPNATFSAAVTVKNQGTAAGNAGLLMVWANKATAATCNATGDQVAIIGTLAAGASKTVTITGLTAPAANSGNLRSFIDAACITVESNEANNQLVTPYILARSDFVVTNLAVTPVSPLVNTAFNVVVTIKNQGAIAGDGGQLRLWLNQLTAQTCAATGGNKNLTVGSIGAGASTTFTFTGLTLPIAGIRTIRAFVDATCASAETNEINNQFTKIYRVLGDADFVVTSMTVTPIKPTVNSIFTLTVTVKNQGTAAGDGGYLDVWNNLTTAATCDEEGTYWADVGILAAGATKTLTLALPAGTAGTKTARAFVDSWCEIVESNETNNQMIKAYSVQ